MPKNIAALLTLTVVGFWQPVNADDWGCEVLLCLSNPNGPMAVQECVAPIQKLYRELLRGRPFPRCELASSSSGSSWAQQVYDPFDPCPPSLQPTTGFVSEVKLNPANGHIAWQGPAGRSVETPRDGEMNRRACVGGYVGSVLDLNLVGDANLSEAYTQVVWQDAKSPNAIDVYIDNAFMHRVRW